jgi:hypothetical protein
MVTWAEPRAVVQDRVLVYAVLDSRECWQSVNASSAVIRQWCCSTVAAVCSAAAVAVRAVLLLNVQ